MVSSTARLTHSWEGMRGRAAEGVSRPIPIPPESALGSLASVALSSAQVEVVVVRERSARHCSSNSRSGLGRVVDGAARHLEMRFARKAKRLLLRLMVYCYRFLGIGMCENSSGSGRLIYPARRRIDDAEAIGSNCRAAPWSSAGVAASRGAGGPVGTTVWDQ